MEVEKTREAFESYILETPDNESCKYMENVHGIVNLCNSHFSCKYQTKIRFQFRLKAKHECRRPHYMKLKKLL